MRSAGNEGVVQSRLLQLHGAQLGGHGFCLLAGRLLTLLSVDRLEHFSYNFDLGFGQNRE